MGVSKRVTRDGVGGVDRALPVTVGRGIPQGANFVIDGVTVSIAGGKDRRLVGERCATNRVFVNFLPDEVIVKTGWLAEDFTGAVQFAFDPPVAGFGTQYAVSSTAQQTEFDALLRVVLDTDEVATFDNTDGVTKMDMNGGAVFLGAVATGGDRIKTALIDVRPKNGATLLSLFINSLQVSR